MKIIGFKIISLHWLFSIAFFHSFFIITKLRLPVGEFAVSRFILLDAKIDFI
jgi:hypothetical protein